jgi:hypothetical protein
MVNEGNGVLDYVKYVVSTCACVLDFLIIGLIFTDRDNARQMCTLALPSVPLDLSAMAHYGGGSQGSLVGLAPSTEEAFKDTHITYKCCEDLPTGNDRSVPPGSSVHGCGDGLHYQHLRWTICHALGIS